MFFHFDRSNRLISDGQTERGVRRDYRAPRTRFDVTDFATTVGHFLYASGVRLAADPGTPGIRKVRRIDFHNIKNTCECVSVCVCVHYYYYYCTYGDACVVRERARARQKQAQPETDTIFFIMFFFPLRGRSGHNNYAVFFRRIFFFFFKLLLLFDHLPSPPPHRRLTRYRRVVFFFSENYRGTRRPAG